MNTMNYKQMLIPMRSGQHDSGSVQHDSKIITNFYLLLTNCKKISNFYLLIPNGRDCKMISNFYLLISNYKVLLITTCLLGFSLVSAQTYNGQVHGEFKVDLTGNATYNIPIEMVGGVNNIQPNISLSYSSQGGMGVVGLGWNISGLSSISRTSSTLYHDGQVDGVDFDAMDRFALDGQRLILKTGTYGQLNSTYETESYSNQRISLLGTTNNLYFLVEQPNGTRVWYGNTGDSKNKFAWNINRIEDAQGNYMTFNYINLNQTINISSIKYTGNSSSLPTNSIDFIYAEKKKERGFVSGVEYRQNTLLKNIIVYDTNLVYRKYEMIYDNNNLSTYKYQRLVKIEEVNQIGEKKDPISFEYSQNEESVIISEPKTNINYQDLITKKQVIGDFDGNGLNDIVFYDKSGGTQINAIFKNYPSLVVLCEFCGGSGNGVESPTSPPFIYPQFDEIFSTDLVSKENVKYKQNTLTFLKKTLDGVSKQATYTFDSYYLKTVQSNLSTPFGGNVAYLEKQLVDTKKFVNIYDGKITTTQSNFVELEKDKIEGDFNGDGLTEILLLTHNYMAEAVLRVQPGVGGRMIYTSRPKDSYLINLDSRISSNFTINVGSVFNYREKAKVFAFDYNGDRITDIIQIFNNTIEIYTIENGKIKLVNSFSVNNYLLTDDKPILFGDYNGDGLADLAYPHLKDQATWNFYFNKGDGSFEYLQQTIPNLIYNIKTELRYGMSLYYYISQDYNGDGKYDIIRMHSTNYDAGHGLHDGDIRVFMNKGYTLNYTNISFDYQEFIRQVNINSIPFFNKFDIYNDTPEFSYYSPAQVTGSNYSPTQLINFNFKNDLKKQSRISKITTGNTSVDIAYEQLNAERTDVIWNAYTKSEKTYQFPYADLNNIPGYYIVDSYTENNPEYSVTKRLKYKGMVINHAGLGLIGFEEISKGYSGSLFIMTYSDKTIFDPLKRNAPIKTQKFFTETINSSPYQETITEYNYTVAPNKVLKLNPIKITNIDYLSTIQSVTDNFTYDSYNNLLSSTTTFNDGNKISQLNTYDNNPTGTGANFYIGRPKSKTETKTIDGNSFITYEELTYGTLPNLASKKRIKSNNSFWIESNYTYDKFGNVFQKTVNIPNMTLKTEKYEYSPDGRYLKIKWDVENFKTEYGYGNFGILSSEKASLNNLNNNFMVSSYEYDGWQRPKKTIDFLGNYTSFFYEKVTANGIYPAGTKVRKTQNTGEASTVYFDELGRKRIEETKSLNNQWIATAFQYDIYDRQTKQSEPFFIGQFPTQWSETIYDDYSRPIKNISYTGKVVEMTYDGLTSSVKDGTKNKITTINSFGNIKTMTDNGGTIRYTYFGNGNLKSTIYDNITISIDQDDWGKKTKLDDPNAGIYTYAYNETGDIKKETTPKGETVYNYDATGRLTSKIVSGTEGDKLTANYTYHPNTKLLTHIDGKDQNGTPQKYTYQYDNYNRLTQDKEENQQNGNFIVTNDYAFDNYGRPSTQKKTILYNSKQSITFVKTEYDPSCGMQTKIIDNNNGKIIWQLNAINQRGQTLSGVLGNGISTANTYDDYGYIKTSIHTNQAGQSIKNLAYQWQTEKSLLTQRQNNVLGITENFAYDHSERLTTATSPQIGNIDMNFDNKGRITENSILGKYTYLPDKPYQLTQIKLNPVGRNQYQQGYAMQQVTYNAFKNPLSVFDERTNTTINFSYNILGGRSIRKDSNGMLRHYNQDGSVEITDLNGQTKIISYIAGDAYSAPAFNMAIFPTNSTPSSPVIPTQVGIYYLHRDYLGSILAISDQAGKAIEQRHYSAWGSLVKLAVSNAQGAMVEIPPSQLLTANYSLLTDRGYTGHEHLWSVGLIHMNGRLYDPNLGRFLSPDNFVQDLFNTQNFNRYSYVVNNPLIYSDPSGEIIWFVVGAVVGAYFAGVQANGTWNPFEFNYATTWQYMVGGAIIGAVSGGVGATVGPAAATAVGLSTSSIAGGAVAGAVGGLVGGVISGGATAGMFGGDMGQGALTGAWQGALAGGVLGGIGGGLARNSLNKEAINAAKLSDIKNGLAPGTTKPTLGNLWTGKNVAAGRNVWSLSNKPIHNPNIEVPPVESISAMDYCMDTGVCDDITVDIQISPNGQQVDPDFLDPIRFGNSGTQFSNSTIDNAVNLVMRDANKIEHLFAPKHNLNDVVSRLGGQENTIRAVLNAANGKLPSNGTFNIPVNVGGETIFIRGNVVNGIPRIGTMFIP